MPGCGSLSGEQEFIQFEMSIGLNIKILAFLTPGVSAWWWKMFQQSKYLLQEDTESKSNSDPLCIGEDEMVVSAYTATPDHWEQLTTLPTSTYFGSHMRR